MTGCVGFFFLFTKFNSVVFFLSQILKTCSMTMTSSDEDEAMNQSCEIVLFPYLYKVQFMMLWVFLSIKRFVKK